MQNTLVFLGGWAGRSEVPSSALSVCYTYPQTVATSPSRPWKMQQVTNTQKRGNRPGLEVQYGVLHSSLVVFAHVLMHVWVVGADIFFRAPVGHRAKLQRWVLLLGVLKLVEQREVGEGEGRGMRDARLHTNLSDLFLSALQTNLKHSMSCHIFYKGAVCNFI